MSQIMTEKECRRRNRHNPRKLGASLMISIKNGYKTKEYTVSGRDIFTGEPLPDETIEMGSFLMPDEIDFKENDPTVFNEKNIEHGMDVLYKENLVDKK